MAYVYAAHSLISTGGKFQLVSNFIEFHALTLAPRSDALLTKVVPNYLSIE